MLACVCRGISDKEFDTEQELKERIMQNDAQCCACRRYYGNNEKLDPIFEKLAINKGYSIC